MVIRPDFISSSTARKVATISLRSPEVNRSLYAASPVRYSRRSSQTILEETETNRLLTIPLKTSAEGGIRLPMIVRAPGTVPQGVKSDLQIAMWDMLPTFADFAGTQLPEDTQIDGISFYPAFCGRYGEQTSKISLCLNNDKVIFY